MSRLPASAGPPPAPPSRDGAPANVGGAGACSAAAPAALISSPPPPTPPPPPPPRRPPGLLPRAAPCEGPLHHGRIVYANDRRHFPYDHTASGDVSAKRKTQGAVVEVVVAGVDRDRDVDLDLAAEHA